MSPFPLILSALAFCAMITAVRGDETFNIKIFHTSDIHGYLYGHLHDPLYNAYYGDVRSYIDCKMAFEEEDDVFFVFDSGDIAQGTGLSDATEPPFIKLYPIEDKFGYDAATLGNHDIGVPESIGWLYESEYMEDYGITSNIMYTGEVFDKCDYSLPYFRKPYIIIERKGLKVLVVSFQVVDSRYETPVCTAPIEGFFETKEWEESSNMGPFDFIIALNHIGSNDPTSQSPVYAGLRSKFPLTPLVFLNGHNMVIADGRCDEGGYTNGTEDNQCIYLEENKYLEVFGEVVFTLTRYNNGETSIDYDLNKFHETVIANMEVLESRCPDSSLMPSNLGSSINEDIKQGISELGLFNVLGKSNREYAATFETQGEDPIVPSGTLFELYLYAVMPGIVLQGWPLEEDNVLDFYTFNSGMFRSDMYKGDILLDDIYYILPFKNKFVRLDPFVSGKDLKTALALLNTRGIEVHREKCTGACALRALADRVIVGATAPDKFFYPGSFDDIIDDKMYNVITSDYDAIDLCEALESLGTTKYEAIACIKDQTLDQMSALAFYVYQFMSGGKALEGSAGFNFTGVEGLSNWQTTKDARSDIAFAGIETFAIILGLVLTGVLLLLARARIKGEE